MAHFLFFIMGVCAKILVENHHVAEIVFYRNLLAFFPLLAFIYFRKKTHLFKTKKPRMVMFRAVIGAISLMVTYSALALLPMAYATVLFFTSTILTPFFSFLILKENVGIHRWLAVALGMCGVYIIAQPSGNIDTWGVTLALIAAFIHATMFVTLRHLKTESPVTISFYFFLAGAIIPGLFMPFVANLPAYSEIWLFMLVAASGGIAQIFLANAYKYAPAAIVTPFAYSAIIWSIMADIIIWHYDLDFKAITIGAGLIITAQLYILYREYINKEKAKRNA